MILDNKLYFKGSLLLYGLLVLFSCKSDDVVPTEQEEQQEEIELAPQDRLPQVFIDTKGASIVDEPKISSDAVMVVANDTVYQGNLGIEFRGATTQGFPKKSYGLETWDANDEDTDVALLGFPEEEDWILYGPYSDKSLMRNVLIYDLSRDMERYASRTQFVDLTLNDVYQGVYVFMEKLKRDGERIDINRLRDDENSGEDVTGGYILKIDKTAGNNLGEGYNDLNSITSLYAPTNATLGQQIHFLYEYPDAEDITMAQKEYIASYMANFEAALASDTFADAETGYANFIDVQSFIDFFILNELANNVDGYRLSTFMYKDKNEKLKMGPIWDFNLAFGNADYCGGGASNVWAYRFNERCPQDFWQVPFWWDRLLQDPAFVALLQERWTGLRANLLSNAAIDAKISGYVENLQDAAAVDRNFATWPVLGTYIWPNNFVGDTYMEEVDYLQNWIRNRLSWLDSEISTL